MILAVWSRKEALCCMPNNDAFDTPKCDKPLCHYEGSEFSCDTDLYTDDYSDEHISARLSSSPRALISWGFRLWSE